jgi:hypothetical protein
MDQKKAKELLYVRLFKEKFAEFPAGEIVPHETPDCLVRAQDRCLGIEVTRIFRDVQDDSGHSLQRRVSELEHIVQTARAIHESSGQPPVIVSAFFSKHHGFGRADRQTVANSLAEVVCRDMPQGMGRYKIQYDPAKSYFSNRIDEVHITRLPGLTHDLNQWTAPEAAWARPHGPEFLQSVLDGKAASYDAYRLNCDEVWLIILSGTERLASIVHFAEGALQHQYTTPFDRAFLFEDGTNVFPLKTASNTCEHHPTC